MNYRSIVDLNTAILKGIPQVPRDVDLIVGIPRSGMLPANLLALYLNKPYTDLESFLNGHIYRTGERGRCFNTEAFRKILVVDDSVYAGEAMKVAKEKLRGRDQSVKILYCAVYMAPGAESVVNLWFEKVPTPRVFQWNVLHHSVLEKTCIDIDGVLCVDPTEKENDDGPLYLDFVKNAMPLFIPTRPVAAVVTSRLEKYRECTEIWLRENGVQYGKLVMLNLPNKEARQKAGCHASHKSAEFRKQEYSLFIESDINQAIQINQIAKKPVLCTANFELAYGCKQFFQGNNPRRLSAMRSKFWKLFRKLIQG